ncbi:MAG: imidazoleglycerol-phosphate dehydratase [Loktanella sp.]|nr:imidazoleglycerol-phosphate dehydratase [Loktanella sp.]
MKAMILRDDAADAVQTAHLLSRKGFQTYCVGSRDIAQAMLQAELIDLLVMDERIGAQLTHALALSAERRNPYLSTIIMTDQGAEATDDLYDLIPSLYALIGTRTGTDMMGQIVLSAVANADEAARRIDRRLALEAAEIVAGDDDLDDDLAEDDTDDRADALFAQPALREFAATARLGWGDYAALRPQLVVPQTTSADKVCA